MEGLFRECVYWDMSAQGKYRVKGMRRYVARVQGEVNLTCSDVHTTLFAGMYQNQNCIMYTLASPVCLRSYMHASLHSAEHAIEIDDPPTNPSTSRDAYQSISPSTLSYTRSLVEDSSSDAALELRNHMYPSE
jgi:hypothetical protein